MKLIERAELGDVSILSDPEITVVKDCYGWTALHALAFRKKREVLKHPEVTTLKYNNQFYWQCIGATPLHCLAVMRVLKESDLKNLFPWYKHKDIIITYREVTEILNTAQSIQYILE